MLRISLDLISEPTWGDLRKYVALNHAAQDHEPLGIEFNPWGDDQISGLEEVIPSKEVLPRG